MNFDLMVYVREPSHKQAFFLNQPEIPLVKFSNSNTNTLASTAYGEVLKNFKSDWLEFGYFTAGNLYDLIKHSSYKEFQKHAPDRDRIRQCSTAGDVYSDGTHEGFKPILCGNRNECLVDSFIYSSGLARDVFDLFKAISDKWHNMGCGEFLYFLDDTFTLPKNLALKLDELGGEGRKMFRDAQKRFYYLFNQGMPAAIINHQDWSSSHPLDAPFVHCHTQSLNLIYNNQLTLSGTRARSNFFEVNPYVDIDLALSVWYGCVKRLATKAGVILEASILSGDKSLVWNREYVQIDPIAYQTTPDGKRVSNYSIIKHKINYAIRKPLGDIVKYFDSSYFNGYLSDHQQDRLEYLVKPEMNKKQHVWIGWLSDGVKNEYLSLLNIYVKTKKQMQEELKHRDQEDSYICPICGETMTLKDKLGNLVSIRDIFYNTIILSNGMKTNRLKQSRVVDLTLSESHRPCTSNIYDYDVISIHDLNEMRCT